MANPNPCPATRFKPGHTGHHLVGEPIKAVLRAKLREANKSGDKTVMEEVVDHLIEVATKWDIIVVGKDWQTGEPIRVASGRDAISATSLLLAYAYGKPVDDEASRLALAEHLRKVEADRFQFAKDLLGERLKTMAPTELAEFFTSMAPNVQAYLEMADEMRAKTTERIVANLALPPKSDGEESNGGTTTSEEKGNE